MNDYSFPSNDIHTQNYPFPETAEEPQISLEQVYKTLKFSPILLLASNPHASVKSIIMADTVQSPAIKLLRQPFILSLSSAERFACDSVSSSLIHLESLCCQTRQNFASEDSR